jgi:hypothetical protein
MPSLLNDASHWLDRAEEARIAAEQHTDPDAKKTMLQLAQHYLQLAQVAASRARIRKRELALATRSDARS